MDRRPDANTIKFIANPRYNYDSTTVGVIYSGDGSSDIHVMLQINARDGLTIAVSESPNVSQIAKRTVLSSSALAVLAPILEEIGGWERAQIRSFFEAHGMLIQEWERVRTDWLTVRPAITEDSEPIGVA